MTPLYLSLLYKVPIFKRRGISMSFDYDKIKKNQDSGSHWTSYSDLFMVLSVVFLMLYVVANLRTGTHTLMQEIQKQSLKDELQSAISAKEREEAKVGEYMEKMAKKHEQETYQRLMDKLDLLQEKNKDEAAQLRAKALENEDKSKALNEYQRIIKDIIQANVLQKRRIAQKNRVVDDQEFQIKEQTRTIASKDETIKSKDKTIAQKEVKISELDNDLSAKKLIIEQKNTEISEKMLIIQEKESTISELNEDIANKKQIIAQNRQEIENIQTGLEKQVANLKKLRAKRKLDKKQYNIKVKALLASAKEEKAKLLAENKQVQTKLNEVAQEVEVASAQLDRANQTIEDQKKQKDLLGAEINQMQGKLAKAKEEYAAIASEKQKLEMAKDQLLSQREKLLEQKKKLESDKDLLQEKNQSLAAQSRKLAAQKNQLELQKSELEIKKNKLEQQKNELASVNAKLAKINDDLKDDKNQLASVKSKLQKEKERLQKEQQKLKGENTKLAGNLNNLSKDFGKLSDELEKAQEVINAKKELAARIKKNFRDAGIKAEINEGTGEVILAFGDSYFEDNQHQLKPEMKDILNKFMPIYTESIFKDPKISKKIKSVDIIGFASPTYQGMYINPNSLDPKDRAAIEYNTRLSSERAQSVQRHIITSKVLSKEQRQRISPLLKISGKSYFGEFNQDRAPAQVMSARAFCRKYDCKKSRRVIIKYELDN